MPEDRKDDRKDGPGDGRERPMAEALTEIRRLVSAGGSAGEGLTPDRPGARPAPDSPPPPPGAAAPAENGPLADGILSTEARRAAARALGGLPAPEAAPADGGRTIETLAVELMKPMLREWLDANLPEIVEDAVRAEVRRLARRRARP